MHAMLTHATPTHRIRNFALVAHIDHGKSTFADRLLEICAAPDARGRQAQALDTMELERERGITIKAQSVRLNWRARDGEMYVFNLLDTPGHVDFTYEVSRSLSACEGSLLLIDATQGVEAQTLANAWLAVESNHEIIPLFNKMDVPTADPEKCAQQMQELLGLSPEDALRVSAKTGEGIPEVLERLVARFPAPVGDAQARLRALVVDSWYDPYLGAVALVRVFDGILRKGMNLCLMQGGGVQKVEQLGVFLPTAQEVETLTPGEIGFVVAGIKELAELRVGDTFSEANRKTLSPLPGFKTVRPVVFCGFFPADSSHYARLRLALEKLSLNDSSLDWSPESSPALGQGFRCGFLGLLHLEIVRERLLREFDIALVTGSPGVAFQVQLSNGEEIVVRNPSEMPDPSRIERMREPWVEATVLVSGEHVGAVLALCQERRGERKSLHYSGTRVMIVYRLPLSEVIFDFHDRLKSLSRGYASLDWRLDEFVEADLVKLNILVNGVVADGLSLIVHRSKAEMRGRAICKRLKDLIPRQLFKVALQAAIGGRIVARETVSALRKDVTAKCYGGDISRKRKLLEKQKAGKKKMQQIGTVEIPHAAFIAALKVDSQK